MKTMIQLAPHETLELHELVRSEVLAVKKIQASLAMVTDSELKSFMEMSLKTKKDTLNNYQMAFDVSGQQQ